MERVFKKTSGRSNIEKAAVGNISVADFLSRLSAEEFDVLWDLTGEYTVKQIAQRNGLTQSQVNTLRFSLGVKARAYLS
ncbi:MAG TPA: hypothetical protein VI819_02570 [Patescibacteria group bacterium]|nr:hypothetical protein [Patescibacteria group bacterium]